MVKALAGDGKGDYDKAITDYTKATRMADIALAAVPTAIAALPGPQRANTARPSRTTLKPYGMIPKMLVPTGTSHASRQRAPTRNTVMERRPSTTRTRLINWTVVSIGNASAHSRRRMQKMVSSRRPRNGKPRPSNWRRPTSRQQTRRRPRSCSRLELYKQGKPYREELK